MYHCALPTWLPDVTSSNVTLHRRGLPWKGGMHTYATGRRGFLPIRESFDRKWHYETSCDSVELALENMGARMPDRKCPCVLSRTAGSYNLIIFYELALSLVICPFPPILFSWVAPSIITQPFFQVFSDMFEVLCGTPMVYFITSAFLLWYFC